MATAGSMESPSRPSASVESKQAPTDRTARLDGAHRRTSTKRIARTQQRARQLSRVLARRQSILKSLRRRFVSSSLRRRSGRKPVLADGPVGLEAECTPVSPAARLRRRHCVLRLSSSSSSTDALLQLLHSPSGPGCGPSECSSIDEICTHESARVPESPVSCRIPRDHHGCAGWISIFTLDGRQQRMDAQTDGRLRTRCVRSIITARAASPREVQVASPSVRFSLDKIDIIAGLRRRSPTHAAPLFSRIDLLASRSCFRFQLRFAHLGGHPCPAL
jgi:hypothetical protein